MAKHEEKTCASEEWLCSGMTGHGVPSGMIRAHYSRLTKPFRDYAIRVWQKKSRKISGNRTGELDGKLYPYSSNFDSMNPEKTAEGLLHGYLVRYYHKGMQDRAWLIAWYETRQARREASRHARDESWYQSGRWPFKLNEKLRDMGLAPLAEAIELENAKLRASLGLDP